MVAKSVESCRCTAPGNDMKVEEGSSSREKLCVHRKSEMTLWGALVGFPRFEWFSVPAYLVVESNRIHSPGDLFESVGTQHEKELFPSSDLVEKRQNRCRERLHLVNPPDLAFRKPRNNVFDWLEGEYREKLGLEGCFLQRMHVAFTESDRLCLGGQFVDFSGTHQLLGVHVVVERRTRVRVADGGDG